MVIAIWILAGIGIVVWSLVAWGVYRLLTLDPQWVGELEPLIERIPYGDDIERWVPGWQDLLRQAIDAMQVMLGWVGGAAPWAVGAAWLSGTLLMLAGGVLLHLLVRALRRPSGGPGSLTPRP